MKILLFLMICFTWIFTRAAAPQNPVQVQNQGQQEQQQRRQGPVPGQMVGPDVSVHDPVMIKQDGTYYLIYHGYDAKDNGRSKLIIKKLLWSDDGWPEISKTN